MYSIDGELTISRHPEALIGQYGLHHVSHQDSLQSGYLLKTTVKHDVLGSESGVQQAAARLRQQGLIPEDLQVEHITSLEQAQKYPPVTGRTIEIVSFRKPDLGEVLSQMQIPEGEKLLEGFARLWRETHYPSPAVYFLAVGHLLETMEYNPELGWSNPDMPEKGRWTEKGLVIPIFRPTRHPRTEVITLESRPLTTE